MPARIQQYYSNCTGMFTSLINTTIFFSIVTVFATEICSAISCQGYGNNTVIPVTVNYIGTKLIVMYT